MTDRPPPIADFGADSSRGTTSEPCPDETTILAYVEEKLPIEARKPVARHLADCPECASLVSGLIKLARPPDFSDEEVRRSDKAEIAAFDGSQPGLRAGTRIGRYVVLEEVGRGGMGTVYAAYDPTLDRKVALKLVRAGLLTTNVEALRARLLVEAQAMAKLSHRNVCAVHDVQPFGDEIAIAMEYIEGTTLDAWLKATRRSWREVLRVFIQAGEGLGAAHRAGLIHRDFKPDNVLIQKGGRVVVSDFGLVHVLDESCGHQGTAARALSADAGDSDRVTQAARPITHTGTLMGTPAYMAPEQILGRTVDERTDQFAFCVALHEALYGERPFTAETLDQLKAQTLSNKIRVPKSSEVPTYVRNILLRGLERNPHERFRSMEELLTVLRSDPTHTRKKILALATPVACLALALAAALSAWHRDRPQACGSRDELLAGVWDAKIKGTIREAFLATRVPHAESSFHRFAHEMDRYSADLQSGFHANCRSTGGTTDANAIAAAQAMCLLSARAAASSLARRLSNEVDAELMGNSVAAAQRLPEVSLCNDVASLQAMAARSTAATTLPPDDGQIELLLQDADVLTNLGRPREALEKAREAITRAKNAPTSPLNDRALYQLGRAFEVLGRFDDAYSALDDAAGRSAIDGDVRTYVNAMLLQVAAQIALSAAFKMPSGVLRCAPNDMI
jgi:eukaryotic-like serine/threonine-protein kinase